MLRHLSRAIPCLLVVVGAGSALAFRSASPPRPVHAPVDRLAAAAARADRLELRAAPAPRSTTTRPTTGAGNPARQGEARTMGASAAALVLACPAVTAELATAGRKIFTGKGNCYTCHGTDAKGTPLAPNLVSHKWINIDGSYDAIVGVITHGVAQPKEHPAPMPPMGGAQLNAGEICQLAAYVYSLSHKG